MKKLKYIALALLLGMGVSSCEDMLDDNKNPDKSIAVTPEQILPVVVFYSSQINYDHAEYGSYLSQALTTGGKSQTGSYAYKSGWEFLTMNRHPQWRRHFFDIGSNVKELISAAEKVNSKNFILIARTIRLMSTQLTTDMFGDMPRSEAYTSNSPKYDSQESIYKWMLSEADELISLYNDPSWTEAPNNIKITQKMDRIFSGDLKKWKQFTCALKARILLRKLPNWDNTPATCQQIIDAVDAAYTADWEEPRYQYDGGTGVKSSPWGQSKPIINGWESRDNQLDKAIVSKYFCEGVMGVYASPSLATGKAEDPRLERMMTARSGPADDASVKFRYLENNIGMGVSYKESNYPDLYAGIYTKDNGYIPLMTTEELLLIKAEAEYWKGDKSAARTSTIEAANINMNRYGVPNKTPRTNYFDGKFKDKYFPEGNAFTIKHLMHQKYVCMYLQPEQWTDLRRYNYSNDVNKKTYDGVIVYPGLKRPYNLYEPYWCTEKNADGSIKEVWIQRINYDPETEEKYNKAELERLGAYKNADWLKVPMIWAVYSEVHK
ncbi:SusD/RagB family nutrient-binding outer membrane lipoprotein [uncultured Bacteroides sp.]|uniref:SusD/RagB family nutrient-binding outer membrane lipoprotein n=1 Tax=uncultured Bacteroides sp. TaxID=162156 RepID=UPI002AAAF3D3|nr:SusD/RagB family nutrient-binding outer membrane lipoprotein [uncultured Bacteroides sp.]